MTDDIVKALRELDADKPDPWEVCCEAADEIERLRELLRKAYPLVQIFKIWRPMTAIEHDDVVSLVADIDAALNKGGGDEGK